MEFNVKVWFDSITGTYSVEINGIARYECMSIDEVGSLNLKDMVFAVRTAGGDYENDGLE